MRLWLDDQLDDPEYPERAVPEGWVGVKTALQACRLISTGLVTHLSFDHDLGHDPSGYVVAKFIEKRAALGMLRPLGWDVHSANPTGRQNIIMAMKSAERFWENASKS